MSLTSSPWEPTCRCTTPEGHTTEVTRERHTKRVQWILTCIWLVVTASSVPVPSRAPLGRSVRLPTRLDLYQSLILYVKCTGTVGPSGTSLAGGPTSTLRTSSDLCRRVRRASYPRRTLRGHKLREMAEDTRGKGRRPKSAVPQGLSLTDTLRTQAGVKEEGSSGRKSRDTESRTGTFYRRHCPG